MVNKLEDFPGGRRTPMDWRRYADGSIYEFTAADRDYGDPQRFRTAARMWGRRNGYRLTSSLVAKEGHEPSVVIRFTKI